MSISADEARSLLASIDGAAPKKGVPKVERLCGLWAGMGSILLVDGRVVVKRVTFPKSDSRGDVRKIESYRHEAAFYARHAPKLLAPPHSLELPRPLLVQADDKGLSLCMSRLDGTPPAGDLSDAEAHAAARWLATLHAAYWGITEEKLDGLQLQGTYWYLDTRPDELDSMPRRGWEARLRLAARAIDLRLKHDALQTVVHGDAKDANMLFSRAPGGEVRAQLCDFQYCGRAPPSKDLAYFFACACGVTGRPAEATLLEAYHATLATALREKGVQPPPLEWLCASVDVAYADLARFMSGWGWWGRAELSKRARALLDELDGGAAPGEGEAAEAAYERAIMERYPPDYQSGGAAAS